MEQEQPQPDHSTLMLSLRFIEQICFLLKLPRPCTKTSMDYYHLLSNSQTHQYPIEIMISSSIFLAAKIFEHQTKIRDIINMVFIDTALHRLIRQEEGQSEQKGERFSVKQLFGREGIKEILQPNYSFNNYNDLKPKILEAQQHLLRILGFDFNHSSKNMNQTKTILVLIHQLRLPQITAQTILNTYHDLPFTGCQKWIAGVVYFGYLVGRSVLKDSPRDNVLIGDVEWQTVFCTKIQKLRHYATKISTFYQNNPSQK